MKYYGLSKSRLNTYCERLKQTHVFNNIPAEYFDTSRKPSDQILKEMRAEAEAYGFEFTDAMARSLIAAETERSQTAYSWLASFFHLIGDIMPNSKEIHIDPQLRFEDIYSEYCEAMQAAGIKPLALNTFRDVRTKCFPHVKDRQYKAVSGKCHACALLSEVRSKVRYLLNLHII